MRTALYSKACTVSSDQTDDQCSRPEWLIIGLCRGSLTWLAKPVRSSLDALQDLFSYSEWTDRPNVLVAKIHIQVEQLV